MGKLLTNNLTLLLCLVVSVPAWSQEDVQSINDSTTVTHLDEGGKILKNENIEEYRRSSLYSTLISHNKANYADAIYDAFINMPMPDKFNNHNLDLRVFESSAAKAKKIPANKRGTPKDPNIKDINTFIKDNDIARNLVSMWMIDPEKAVFTYDKIADRAYYDASALAIENAQNTYGLKMLEDAGTDLINNTFMIVNDITFIDNGENSAKAASVFAGIGKFLESAGLSGAEDLGNMVAVGVNEIDGFKVNIITYLYRLHWSEELLNTVFTEWWFDENTPEEEAMKKLQGYLDTDIFHLDYIGSTYVTSQNLSSKSFSSKTKTEQMLTVCTRAIDKAIVQLQREYDEFKVNVPIYEVNDDGTVLVKIGLKEGVNSKSKYEVLMKDESDGVLKYKRVGMLKPVADKIWDNRFGALEEAEMLAAEEKAAADSLASNPAPTEEVVVAEDTAADAANTADAEITDESEEDENGNVYLEGTTFKITSGAGKIYPGMLIREVTIKN